VSKKVPIITLRLEVSGLHLDAQSIGKKSANKHGHIQVYLDKIPAAAYKKGSSQNLVIAVGSSSFSFQMSKSWVKLHKGKHHLVLALAKNNLLYRAPAAKIAVTVK
jgi:hypothetical protein